MTVENPNLGSLIEVLKKEAPASIRIFLPGGEEVPANFHVTEVGRVQKDFIDCGGTVRRSLHGQLQLLVANDFEHRISAEKLLKILAASAPVLGDEPLPLSVEYGQKTAVVFEVTKLEMIDGKLELRLGDPETGCLAPDTCGLPYEEAGRFTPRVSVSVPDVGC